MAQNFQNIVLIKNCKITTNLLVEIEFTCFAMELTCNFHGKKGALKFLKSEGGQNFFAIFFFHQVPLYKCLWTVNSPSFSRWQDIQIMGVQFKQNTLIGSSISAKYFDRKLWQRYWRFTRAAFSRNLSHTGQKVKEAVYTTFIRLVFVKDSV